MSNFGVGDIVVLEGRENFGPAEIICFDYSLRSDWVGVSFLGLSFPGHDLDGRLKGDRKETGWWTYEKFLRPYDEPSTNEITTEQINNLLEDF